MEKRMGHVITMTARKTSATTRTAPGIWMTCRRPGGCGEHREEQDGQR